MQKGNTLRAILEETLVLLTRSATLPQGISVADDIFLAEKDEEACVRRLIQSVVVLDAGDIDGADNLADLVARSMSSTLLTKCAARVLMCNSNKRPHATRLLVMKSTIATLNEMLPPVGREDEQIRVLTLATEMQARLLTGDLAQPPPPIMYFTCCN